MTRESVSELRYRRQPKIDLDWFARLFRLAQEAEKIECSGTAQAARQLMRKERAYVE